MTGKIKRILILLLLFLIVVNLVQFYIRWSDDIDSNLQQLVRNAAVQDLDGKSTDEDLKFLVEDKIKTAGEGKQGDENEVDRPLHFIQKDQVAAGNAEELSESKDDEPVETQAIFKQTYNDETSKPAETRVRLSENESQQTHGNSSSVVRQSADSAHMNKTEIRYHGRDLLKDPVYNFDSHFKNPCWFENKEDGTQALRCLPYVFIIGVKKCGTSDLFFRLSQHPDFCKPGFKEAQFFARSRFREPERDDIEKYVDMFDGCARTILESSKKCDDGKQCNSWTITGEASPSNLHLNTHWQHLPGNEGLSEPKYVILDYIHHFLPQAKIMITFRDPIERLYSDYYHEYGTLMPNNDPSPVQFHEIVTMGLRLYRDCFAVRSVRSCAYDPALYDKTKMSYHQAYELVRQPLDRFKNFDFKPDRMAVIATLNRIAQVSIQRIMLMMNNTEMCKKRRMTSISDVIIFISGKHDDEGLSGDRGDFYRRQLADQIHVTFAIEGVTHTNVVGIVEAAVVLERETRRALANSAKGRDTAPSVSIDENILNILARIADVF